MSLAWDSDALKKSMLIAAGSGLLIGAGAAIPFVNLVCCCIGWALWGAVGASYGAMSQRGGKPVDVGTWALGGAAVAAVGSVVRSVVFTIGTAILTLLGVAVSSTEALNDLGLDVPSGLGQTAGEGIVGSLVGGCINGAITLFIAAVMGAIGGAIWGAIRQGSSSAPAQPAV